MNYATLGVVCALMAWPARDAIAQSYQDLTGVGPAYGYGDPIVIDGNRMVVGDWNHRVGRGQRVGGVYLYQLINGEWRPDTLFTHPDDRETFFGSQAAMDGRTLVVSAVSDREMGIQSGAAFVYRRNAMDEWGLFQKLTTPEPAGRDGFGGAPALWRDHLLISASPSWRNRPDKVFAYRWEDGRYAYQQKLSGSVVDPEALFGHVIALGDSVAFVSAPSGERPGTVHRFRLRDGVWSEEAVVRAPVPEPMDSFGQAMALSGDLLIVGAPGRFEEGFEGAAHIYREVCGELRLEQTLIAPDARPDHQFGGVVAISHDEALVGTFADSDRGPLAGAVYRFERQGSEWRFAEKMHASISGSRTGMSIALTPQHRFLGVLEPREARGEYTGHVYAYPREAGTVHPEPLCQDTKAASFIRVVAPNPAGQVATIEVTTAEETYARLDLYDALGRRRASLFEGPADLGVSFHRVDVSGLEAGIYFVTLTTAGGRHTETLVVQ